MVIAEHPTHSLKEFLGKVTLFFPQNSPILSTRSHNKPEGYNLIKTQVDPLIFLHEVTCKQLNKHHVFSLSCFPYEAASFQAQNILHERLET